MIKKNDIQGQVLITREQNEAWIISNVKQRDHIKIVNTKQYIIQNQQKHYS